MEVHALVRIVAGVVEGNGIKRGEGYVDPVLLLGVYHIAPNGVLIRLPDVDRMILGLYRVVDKGVIVGVLEGDPTLVSHKGIPSHVVPVRSVEGYPALLVRAEVICLDGKERVCRIPGRLKRSLWVREGDTLLIQPWEFSGDDKGDVIYKYRPLQVAVLKKKGLLKGLEELDEF